MAGAWQRKEGKNPEGGLNAKGRASAKAEGMNLKPPVKSGDNPRRASFLARMAGNDGPESLHESRALIAQQLHVRQGQDRSLPVARRCMRPHAPRRGRALAQGRANPATRWSWPNSPVFRFASAT
mgnify:CR=1 FL=1